jgi:VWFA-related protein
MGIRRLAIFFFLVGPLLAQNDNSTEPVIRSDVREVLLDVVVRGKNMQLARKLKASDFTLTEDGVPQEIRAFRFVSGKATEPVPETRPVSGTSVAPAATPSQAKKMQVPNFVSIVFDEIGPHSREYARKAVHSFLNQELRSDTYVAIFMLDYRMSVIQNFSNNRDMLARAVDNAAMGQYSSLSADNANSMNQTDYSISTDTTGVTITPSYDLATAASLSTSDASTNIDQAAIAAAKMVSDQREIAMYQGGMRTITAIANLVKYESSLPGRKTIIYMSEGLNLPPERKELLWNVISSANRGNVSFYMVDVRGLNTSSPNNLATGLLRSASAASAGQSTAARKGVTEGLAKEEDTLLEVNVANTQMNMRELADATGGFTIADTNEIDKSMLRVMQDVRTHYEISYVPSSKVYDGHYRKIALAVNNPHLSIQSRDGYFALPDLDGQSLQPFEMSGLHALDSKPAPSAFPFQMAAMRFKPAGGGYRYEIAFDLPTSYVTPKVSEDKKTARLHATFLGLIKNDHGEVVEKVSREIYQEVDGGKLEQFRRGQMIFTDPVGLKPGRYTLEGAVTDEEGNRSSTKRIAIVVPASGQVAVSDVALVHDLKPLTVPRDPADPLEFAGGRVTPELDGKSTDPDGASLFFVVYSGLTLVKPRVEIQFFKDGAAIGKAEPQVSDFDEVQSIPVIARAKLPTGNYVARVTVSQAGRVSRRSMAFTVSE